MLALIITFDGYENIKCNVEYKGKSIENSVINGTGENSGFSGTKVMI